MFKKQNVSIIFCLFLICIGGCRRINVHIKFQDIQTCQKFCNSVNILGGEKQTTCHETCQKLEDSKDKTIEIPIKKIPAKKIPIVMQETMTSEDCNRICANLWKSNDQEKINCIVSCTNEIIE